MQLHFCLIFFMPLDPPCIGSQGGGYNASVEFVECIIKCCLLLPFACRAYKGLAGHHEPSFVQLCNQNSLLLLRESHFLYSSNTRVVSHWGTEESPPQFFWKTQVFDYFSISYSG